MDEALVEIMAGASVDELNSLPMAELMQSIITTRLHQVGELEALVLKGELG
jgi:hypothetical protein